MYETLDMSGLVDYTVGGCLHVVVNNQVGGGMRVCVYEAAYTWWSTTWCGEVRLPALP